MLDSLVSHLDIYPTICELAGIEEPPYLQGASLMPLVRSEAAKVNDAIFAEMTYHAACQPPRAVRTERFKYIRRFSDYNRPVLDNCDDSASKTILTEAGWGEQRVPEEQLFDPNELNDLSPDPTHQQILSEMRERLLEDTGDRGPAPARPGLGAPGSVVERPAQARPNDPTNRRSHP